MTKHKEFAEEVSANIRAMAADTEFKSLSRSWLRQSIGHNYPLNFSWLGRPIVQVPQDIYAMQELIWAVKPDLVVETGIAHGGSLVMSASMLAMLDYAEAAATGTSLTPGSSKRRVLGIDVDIRAHNRAAIDAHPMSHLITMIEGSSIDMDIARQASDMAKSATTVLVLLDSNHTHEHVLRELEIYAPLTSVDSYCVVWDTAVEDMHDGRCDNRPWGKGDNPKTAVWEYMKRVGPDSTHVPGTSDLRFEYDRVIENKLALTWAPDGFLRRTS